MSSVTTGKIMKERPIQTKAFDRVTELLQTRSECLVKMFCGTGKSHVIKRLVIEQKKSLSVIVFPSLALIRQFTKEYLGDIDTKVYGLLNVSSEELTDIQSTTDPAQIQHFIANPKTKKQKKIICVTYQSLAVLLDSLGDTKIGIACFDEAHHTTGDKCTKLVYGDEYRAKYEKRVFFTATPLNANGITMFDRERNEIGTYGDCGPLACEYTYLQGLRDAILSLFELRADLYTQDTVGNIYESIARAILTTGNTRVLTFHADAAAESDSETSVLRFVDKAKFVEAFRSVCAKEFPDKIGMFPDSKITFTSITAETKDKDEILNGKKDKGGIVTVKGFEQCTDDEIYIVSSCRTIGEGVDTKKANMCVFVDPKTSIIAIIQNIGRICRKVDGTNRQPATILIPVCIGWEKYLEAGDDPEKRDKLIREQLNDRENGDYNAIMNIVAALKQEDPELYELCLRYPSKFTESEKKHALEEQNRKYESGVDVYPDEIDEMVENGDRVEILTSNMDEPIIYRGFNEEEEDDERPIQRFYEIEEENEDGEMETVYHPIVSMDGKDEDEEASRKRLNPPKPTNRPRFNIHTNDEIKLRWKIGDVALGEQFGSAVLECEVERLDNDDLWKENHGKMCEFMDSKKKSPSYGSKDPEEKKLGKWVSHQKHNYNLRSHEFSKIRMKNIERWQIWTDTLEKYKKYLVIDHVQNWKDTHKKICDFIDANDKAPRMSGLVIDPEEKILGKWISGQKQNYDPLGYELSKHIMKTNPEIWQLWNETLADPRYNKYLVIDRVQDWKENCMNMCEFIDKNGKAPSAAAKDLEEKTLAHWVSSQKACYNHRGPEYSKQIMKNEKVWMKWTDTIADPRYNKYLVLGVQGWMNDFANVCTFIDKNGKAPSSTAKDPEEKKIGCWISSQRQKYDSRGAKFSKERMKNEEVWSKWTETLYDQRYKKHLVIDNVQDWMNDHTKLCEFIEKNHKSPSSHMVKDTAEKKIGSWMCHQKHNYDPRGSEFSKHGMKNREIWQIWKNTLSDPKYCEYLVVDLNQNWKNDHEKMCLYIDKNGKAPSSGAKEPEEKTLSNWLLAQKTKYDPRGAELSKHGMKNPELWQIWTETLADQRYNKYLVIDRVKDWMNNLSSMCIFIDKTRKTPTRYTKDTEEKKLGEWFSDQKKKHDPRSSEFSKHIMKTNPEIWQIWTETIQKYPCLKKQEQEQEISPILQSPSPSPPPSPPIQETPKLKLVFKKKSHLIPNPSLECSAPETNPSNPKRVITDSPYKLTGRAWSTQKSTTTHEKLQSNPAEWHAYHAARDISFQGYDQSQIPRNRIIAHLANKGKDKKIRILDLGCGRNNIAQHFASNKHHKFTIQGYDHVAEEGSGARVGNIANLAAQEEDESVNICIYSQSLMGTDWREYLTEGRRMLVYGGEFIISEHIKMLDEVRTELVRLGCKIEMENADSVDGDEKVTKWFVLVARVG